MTTLLIDSNYLCYRAYYSTGSLSHERSPTGIAYGFMWTILQMSEQFKTNKFLFCWDSKNSKRRNRCSTYKANRVENLTTEERAEKAEIHSQFNLLQISTLPSMGFGNQLIQDGYEADDLIARTVIDNPDISFIAVTADNDLFQLLRYKNFRMFSPVGNKLWTASNFMMKYGVTARDWVIIKSIAGCPGDNVDGIPGVAIKTAVKYLNEELSEKSKQYQKITNNSSMIQNNYQLVRLPYPGMVNIAVKKDNFYEDDLKIAFDNLGFTSFLSGDIWDRWKAFVLK